MTSYRPDKFASAYQTFEGERLWRWLNHPRQVEAMETASYLRRPAIEALSPRLHATFGTLVGSLAVRQMVGHMVRQVMENRGHMVDRANVRIATPGNIFHYGTAYRVAA